MLIETKARMGVFAIALGAYLPQFPSLVPEFEGQYVDFKKTLPGTVGLIDGGIVTTKELAQAAGDKFRAADVDLVILQLLTYATSYNKLPAVRDLDVPVVLVSLQKKLAPDYANTATATWQRTSKWSCLKSSCTRSSLNCPNYILLQCPCNRTVSGIILIFHNK